MLKINLIGLRYYLRVKDILLVDREDFFVIEHQDYHQLKGGFEQLAVNSFGLRHKSHNDLIRGCSIR